MYVENDPALRGIMSTLLGRQPQVDLVLSTGSAAEALSHPELRRCDAALLALALGPEQMNGIDLGLAMREINENIGIVIHSQYRLDGVSRRLPPEARFGWSTLPKTGDMAIEDIVTVLRDAALGKGSAVMSESTETSPLDRMSIRQRAIMGMVASGIKSQEVSRLLGVTYDVVRQDLAKSYRLLVPDANDAEEIRTRAIFTYLELIRDDDLYDGR
jgi:DNA-binding NarL/FixJ family response regulator